MRRKVIREIIWYWNVRKGREPLPYSSVHWSYEDMSQENHALFIHRVPGHIVDVEALEYLRKNVNDDERVC